MTEELSIEMWTIEENVKLHKQLEVAKEALSFIGEMPTIAGNPLGVSSYVIVRANKALAEIDKIG